MRALVETVLVSFIFSIFAVGIAFAQTPGSTVVQVLAYEGQDLVNQGSGFYIDKNGTIVTSAHLLRQSDRLEILEANGERRLARVLRAFNKEDIAVIRVPIPSASEHDVIVFSPGTPEKSDVVSIVGYWSPGKEQGRGFSFFGPSRPKFIASIQPDTPPAKAVVEAISETSIALFTALGRGAYGAPVLDNCGHAAGVVVRGPNMTDEELWEVHMIEPRAFPISSGAVVALLQIAGVEPLVASQDCRTQKATKQDASRAEALEREEEQKKAEQQAKEAKRKAAEADRKAREADKKAEEAEKEKERAEKEAEQIKKDTSKAVEGLSKSVEDKEQALKQEREDRRLYMIYGGGAAAILSCMILLLWAKRKKDLKRAGAALDAANARFSDCLMEGTDSDGAPIALRLSGRDLMKSQNGLVFGRNPDVADIVVADDTVSRLHARATVRDQALYLQDLGSTGGTRVNGIALGLDTEPLEIATSDEIELGGVKLTLRILEE